MTMPDIEAFAINVLGSLIANGITSVFVQLRSLRGIKGRQIKEQIESQWDLRTILQRSAIQVAKALQISSPAEIEKIKLFLCSSEVEAVLRQILVCQMAGSGTHSNMADVEKVFESSFELHTKIQHSKLPAQLFESLVGAVTDAMRAAADKGILGAHEALSSIRHENLVAAISDLQANIELLIGKKPNVGAILEYQEQYRNQVAERFRLVSPPNFERHKRFPITDLYVPSTLTFESAENAFALDTEALIEQMHRVVILGNPGGGKTTLASKLAFDLSTDMRFQGREVVPIVIVLREFGADQRDRNVSVVQFAVSRSTSVYQLEPPPFAFDYLLRNGRAFVIFDGLDELLDTTQRQEVRDAVELFCNLYPSVPVLITSRQVGYEQAPLDRHRFEVLRLNEFDDEQVLDYAQKWFSLDEDLSENERQTLTAAFIRESEEVADLRSNPLMLGLMCSIYREENFIPANRPEVYKKCAMMLFERWDRSRRIKTAFTYEDDLSPLMAYLAHWIYADKKLQGGVTRDQLIERAADYLRSRFGTAEKARGTAEEFIDFCKGRAWIFTDTGSTASGQGLYQFTHRTFLEYFTALYLFRTNPTPTELLRVLVPKITKREWDVVAQLAFHIQSRAVEGAGDSLLAALISFGAGSGPERVNTIIFAARCLEFIRTGPDALRAITAASFETYLLSRSSVIGTPGLPEIERTGDMDPLEALFGYLMRAQIEAHETIAEGLFSLFVQTISGTDEIRSALAAEALCRLITSYRYASYFPRRRRSAKPDGNGQKAEIEKYWRQFRRQIFSLCMSRIDQLASKYNYVARAAYNCGILKLETLVKFHGADAIFRRMPSSFRQDYYGAIGQPILYHFINCPSIEAHRGMFLDEINELSEIGRTLWETSPPWTTAADFVKYMTSWVDRIGVGDDMRQVLPTLDAYAIFGLFALAAVAAETLCCFEDQEFASKIIAGLKLENQIPILGIIGRWFDETVATLPGTEQSGGLTSEQIAFMKSWADHEIKLTTCAVPEGDAHDAKKEQLSIRAYGKGEAGGEANEEHH